MRGELHFSRSAGFLCTVFDGQQQNLTYWGSEISHLSDHL